jgi:hypothetical protein
MKKEKITTIMAGLLADLSGAKRRRSKHNLADLKFP